jgi:transposase
MCPVPRPHPKEFRDDVVAVARRGEAPIKQIAKDFGISESCLRNWIHQADVEDGAKPGVTASESAELREARKRVRLLESKPPPARSTCVRSRTCTRTGSWATPSATA